MPKNIRSENKIVIISGCASGADALGERYALENGFEIEKFPAQWVKYGKSRGTRNMIESAKKHGKDIRIKMI